MKRTFLTELFDLIAPRSCAICGEMLTSTESAICAGCHLHIPFTNYELSPLDNPMARHLWGLVPVERVAALFFYEPKSVVGEMVYDMKYRGQWQLAEALGAILGRKLLMASFLDGIDTIIPTPLTWRRKWQRGYNQSYEIAKGIAMVSGLPIDTKALARKAFTSSQTGKRGFERKENVEGAFVLAKPDRIKGKHLLLVDDIITTGATILACAEALQQAGNVKVSIASLGYTR